MRVITFRGEEYCWPALIDWCLLFRPKKYFEFSDNDGDTWLATYKEHKGNHYFVNMRTIDVKSLRLN